MKTSDAKKLIKEWVDQCEYWEEVSKSAKTKKARLIAGGAHHAMLDCINDLVLMYPSIANTIEKAEGQPTEDYH